MNNKQQGTIGPTGAVRHQVTRDLGDLQVVRASFGWRLRNWLQHRYRDLPRQAAMAFVGRIGGALPLSSRLSAAVYRADWSALAPWQRQTLKELLAQNHDVLDLPRFFGGHVTQYGVLSTRKVTDAGVAFIVDAFQNIVELEIMKYHGFGTGTNAEAAGDTALQTEESTQYATDNVRPTGSTTEGATGNIYRTVGTYSPDSGATRAITEHGVFSQAATGGGTLLDRSVFSAVNLVAGTDSLQTTYELTLTSGG